MNQKDYKEIAGIIKKNTTVQFGRPVVFTKDLINDLTVYFEREHSNDCMERNKPFYKKQFLKDCGIND